MATVFEDLWPNDVHVPEAIVSPRALLDFQAKQLEIHTKGLLKVQVVEVATKERIRLRFEVEAPRVQYQTTLFEIEHRPYLVYPCTAIPPDPLPTFLQPRTWVGGDEDFGHMYSGGYYAENEWLTSSQEEFVEILRKLLNLPEVKSTINSLIAKSNEPNGSAPANGSTGNGDD